MADLRARDLPLPLVEDCGDDWEERAFAGPDSPIAVQIYSPRASTAAPGCIYHIHGGGYVGGAAAQLEFLHRPLSAELECAMVSVDYRLAPETKFPGNIEDCYAGLRWTVAARG